MVFIVNLFFWGKTSYGLNKTVQSTWTLWDIDNETDTCALIISSNLFTLVYSNEFQQKLILINRHRCFMLIIDKKYKSLFKKRHENSK